MTIAAARHARSIFLPLAAGACVALGAWAGRAESSPASMAAPKTAVGVIDLEKLMAALTEVKERNKVLQEQGAEKQGQLNEVVKRRDKVAEDIKMLAQDSKERRLKVAEGIELEQQAKAKAAVLQQLIDIDKGEMIREMYEKIQASTAALAKKEGFDLIIIDDRGIDLPKMGAINEMNARISAKRVLFAADELDLTQRLANVMNAEYSAPAAPAKTR